MLLLQSFGIWVLFVVLAIINGSIRNFYIQPKVGEYAGHTISSGMLILLIFIVTFFFVRHLHLTAARDLLTIGIFWVVLTVLFEFIFGHYVMGNTWSRLLTDYNIFRGRLWSLVLLSDLLAPLICGRLIQ